MQIASHDVTEQVIKNKVYLLLGPEWKQLFKGNYFMDKPKRLISICADWDNVFLYQKV